MAKIFYAAFDGIVKSIVKNANLKWDVVLTSDAGISDTTPATATYNDLDVVNVTLRQQVSIGTKIGEGEEPNTAASLESTGDVFAPEDGVITGVELLDTGWLVRMRGVSGQTYQFFSLDRVYVASCQSVSAGDRIGFRRAFNYIWNQIDEQQPESNFWISGVARIDTALGIGGVAAYPFDNLLGAGGVSGRFAGRVKGQDGVAVDEFVTMGQVTTLFPGTVTSVGLSLPSIFNVTGSPVVAAGTLAATFIDQPANLVFAGPAAGADASPSFRSLVAADIPSLAGSYIQNQFASAQTAAFWVNGQSRIDNELLINIADQGGYKLQVGGSVYFGDPLLVASATAGAILHAHHASRGLIFTASTQATLEVHSHNGDGQAEFLLTSGSQFESSRPRWSVLKQADNPSSFIIGYYIPGPTYYSRLNIIPGGATVFNIGNEDFDFHVAGTSNYMIWGDASANRVGIATNILGATLTIGGDLKVNTIANATVDTDKFLVDDNGLLKYRTGVELISDLGIVGLTDGDKGDITVSSSGTVWTIDNSAVTYAKIQNVSNTSRFLGRITAGAGVIEELTGTQATTLLDVFTDTLKGLVPLSGGGTTNFLRADGSWAAPPSGGGGDVVGPASSVDNHVVFFDGTTGKLIKDSGLTLSGSNTGDQTSIVGITGTKAQFNTALTDGDFLFVGDVVGLTDGDKGDITISSSGTVWTIDNSAVTYAKIQNVSNTSRLLGRITAGAGVIEELTGTQATTLLDVFTDTLKGLVPLSGGGTTNFLRADGSWAAPPGGGGGTTINNDANNRVTTAMGTGELNAEANLTFDGSLFTVVGKQIINGGSANWNTSLPGTTTGSLHIVPTLATNHHGGAITFGAHDTGSGLTAQAGIYVRTDGAYGTRMYFATSGNYTNGSAVGFMLSEGGKIAGGESTTSTLTLVPTIANAASGAKIMLNAGNNGSINGLTVFEDGVVSAGYSTKPANFSSTKFTADTSLAVISSAAGNTPSITLDFDRTAAADERHTWFMILDTTGDLTWYQSRSSLGGNVIRFTITKLGVFTLGGNGTYGAGGFEATGPFQYIHIGGASHFNSGNQQNNFRVDGTNDYLIHGVAFTNRVGIRTDDPQAALDVRGGAVFNYDAADVDFLIKSDTHADAFFLDGTAGAITMGAYGGGSITGTATYAAAWDSNGNLIEIALGGGSISDGDKGDITVSSSGTVWTIDNSAVTYAKIQNVSATNRFLGRITAGAGVIEELTGTQATTLLDVFTDTLKGLVPLSGGGTTNFLRADGSWAAPAGGGDVVGPASSVDNRVVFFDGTTGKLIKDSGLTLSGSNTGDQTSIVGITGTKAQFNTALTDGDFLFVGDVVGLTDGDKGDITVSSSGTAWAIDNSAVTYAKIQNVSATNRFLGRITAGAGVIEELSGTQATTLLDLFTDSLQGLVPASGGGTTNFLRADGSWATPGGGGDVVGPASSVNNRVVFFDGTTGKLIKDSGLTLSGSNTGDQTSIVGITGTKAQFNTALTDGDFLFVGDVVGLTDGDKGDITVSSSGTTWAIDNSAVTYAKIQNVSNTSRLLGRITAGAGVIEELTGTQATTLLDVFTDTLKGLVPLSGGGTTNFLRADGSWAAPAGGGDVVGPASSVDNHVVFFDGTTGKLIKDSGLTLSGSNTGDQTSIVGITGTKAQFNTALTDGDFLFVGDAVGLVVGSTAITSGTAGRILFEGSGNVLQQDSALTYDATNNILGVGVSGSLGIIQVTGVCDSNAVGPIIAVTTGTGIIGAALTLDATSDTGGGKWSFISTGSVATGGAGNFGVYKAGYGYGFFLNGAGELILGLHSSYTDLGDFKLQVNGNQALTGFFNIAEQAAPGTPASGFGSLYAKTDGKIYWKDDAGTEFDLTATGGGGVSDGDKGDITVSSSGTVWTIDNSAVTYAKIQNVSTTSRFLGRITAGAGVIEELTGTQATTLLDTFTSALKGLVPASGGGTTNFLRADGSWAAPSVGSVALNAITSATGTNSIDNVGYSQTWNWGSLADQVGLTLMSDATDLGTEPGHCVLGVITTGANEDINKSTLSTQIVNNRTGTGSVNTALLLAALDGDTNYSARVLYGIFQIGDPGGNHADHAILQLVGKTSGAVNIKTADVAGTWDLTLPTGGGTNGYFLQTNGSGVTSWQAVVGLTDGDKGDITVSSSGTVWAIDNSAVTYAKIQNVSNTSRFLGRITAGAGVIEELTGTQATTLLDVFTSALKGLVPLSGGGTTNFLRADGSWAAPPGGGSTAISDLTLATATNDIDNTTYTQTWRWTGLIGVGLDLISASTDAVENGHRVLQVSTSGANSNATTVTYAGYFLNDHTGSDAQNYALSANAIGTGTNIALELFANGGTNNYALIVSSSGGNSGFGTTSPSATLHVSGTMKIDLASSATGDIFYRNSSGFLTRLAAGTDGHVLTLASGLPSWVAPSGGGEANTASNLGGGLANWDSKSGVDLRFNTFATADFDLASNVISIDGTKWLTIAAAAAAYQPLDSDLTTLAGLTATTDNFIVSVASAWASRTPSQVRTTLGLVVGTNVQAYSATLDTWATKTPPSGTVVGTTDTQTLSSKRITPRVTSISSNATWSPNADTDDVYLITAQAAAVTTINNPSGTPTDGQTLTIRVKDNGTARAIAGWGTQYRASTYLAFPTTTTISKHMYMRFMWCAADSKWDLIAVIDGF